MEPWFPVVCSTKTGEVGIIRITDHHRSPRSSIHSCMVDWPTKLRFRFARAMNDSVMSAHQIITELLQPAFLLPSPPQTKTHKIPGYDMVKVPKPVDPTSPTNKYQHPNNVAKVTENGSNGLGAPGIPQFNLWILAAALRQRIGKLIWKGRVLKD